MATTYYSSAADTGTPQNTTNFMKVVMFEYSGYGENYKTPHRQLVSNYKCVKIDTTLVPIETLNGLDKEH